MDSLITGVGSDILPDYINKLAQLLPCDDRLDIVRKALVEWTQRETRYDKMVMDPPGKIEFQVDVAYDLRDQKWYGMAAFCYVPTGRSDLAIGIHGNFIDPSNNAPGMIGRMVAGLQGVIHQLHEHHKINQFLDRTYRYAGIDDGVPGVDADQIAALRKLRGKAAAQLPATKTTEERIALLETAVRHLLNQPTISGDIYHFPVGP